jgi:hypothetical protein
MEMNFASKGVAGTALGLSIGSLGAQLLSGGLGNLFSGTGGCSDNVAVNRYELNQQKEITNRDMEIAYLKGRDAAKTDTLELYRYIDGKFAAVEGQIEAQAVVNAQITANISCMQSSIAALQGLTKTVIPITNVCPLPATATTATTTAG